ncbi:hypothetical protein RCL1_002043 [Eukaryota sp. TZLM3-RCL]
MLQELLQTFEDCDHCVDPAVFGLSLPCEDFSTMYDELSAFVSLFRVLRSRFVFERKNFCHRCSSHFQDRGPEVLFSCSQKCGQKSTLKFLLVVVSVVGDYHVLSKPSDSVYQIKIFTGTVSSSENFIDVVESASEPLVCFSIAQTLDVPNEDYGQILKYLVNNSNICYLPRQYSTYFKGISSRETYGKYFDYLLLHLTTSVQKDKDQQKPNPHVSTRKRKL